MSTAASINPESRNRDLDGIGNWSNVCARGQHGDIKVPKVGSASQEVVWPRKENILIPEFHYSKVLLGFQGLAVAHHPLCL